MARAYRKKKGLVIQRHHLKYQRKDEGEKTGETVLLYKGEHWAISLMQRRKHISKGFLRALEYWIRQVESSAVELRYDTKSS